VSVLAVPPGGRPALLRFNDDGPLRPRDFRGKPKKKGS
jgi:hypothetical protein